jgi:hypothetical protein
LTWPDPTARFEVQIVFTDCAGWVGGLTPDQALVFKVRSVVSQLLTPPASFRARSVSRLRGGGLIPPRMFNACRCVSQLGRSRIARAGAGFRVCSVAVIKDDCQAGPGRLAVRLSSSPASRAMGGFMCG